LSVLENQLFTDKTKFFRSITHIWPSWPSFWSHNLEKSHWFKLTFSYETQNKIYLTTTNTNDSKMSWYTNDGKMLKLERLKKLNFQVILEFPKMFLCLKLKSSICLTKLHLKNWFKLASFLLIFFFNMAIMTSTDLEKSRYEVVFSDPKSIENDWNI
jgi:hypothetical protein